MNKIGIVGNPPAESIEFLDELFKEEDMKDLCQIEIYSDQKASDDQMLADAIADFKDNHLQGIVCLPLNCNLQSEIQKGMQTDEEATEEAAKEKKPLLSVHINTLARLMSVREQKIDAELTTEEIVSKVTAFVNSLKRDLGIQNPRIVFLNLNKEITETSEEMTIIAPAINELVKSGKQVFGPLPYHAFFERKDISAFDGVVQIYADNASKVSHHSLDAMRKNCNEPTVTMLTGTEVPLVSTTPEGMMTAICTILDMIRNRREYDLPFRHPLPKLYHERKEDGDKARFAKVKKGFNPAEHRRENVTYTTIRQPKTTPETPSATPNKAEGAE